jgi:ATP-binding cassette subfamily C protein LapB
VPSLRNISLKIKAGEKIASLGRIGSGKSTLQRLIMGMYQATEGAIHIDGIDIRQLDLADLRHNTGYAAQDVTLFFGSLRDNLLIAQPQLEDEDALQAIEIAGLADFVKSHPRGLDMLIGERGESLSGGQRKAVSLARGIVHNPNILLLDEPTGSMDHSTEMTVKKNLENFSRDKTLIMVTHHTTLLDMVDRIIVIDAGKVVADGPKQQVVDALKKGRIGSAA